MKPSRKLCAAYAMQALLTGLPLFVVDLLVTGIGFVLASYVVNGLRGEYAVSEGIWLQLPALLVLQSLLLSTHQLYPGAGINPIAELRGVVRSTCVALLCLAAMNQILGRFARVELLAFLVAAACVATVLPSARWGIRRLLACTSWWGLRVLLIGQRDDCVASFRQLTNRRASGLNPVGCTCKEEEWQRARQSDTTLFLGADSDVRGVACQHTAPLAGLVSPETEIHRVDQLIFQFPSIVWINFARAAREGFDTSKLPQVYTARHNAPFLRFAPRVVKRSTDLAICIPLLLVLAIPMLLISIIIRINSPGPAFFGHPRIGQHGSRFRAWKFRTMVNNGDEVLHRHLTDNPAIRDEWERTQKLKHDPRVIGMLGDFLRKWSLDELPQLWNVLLGQMSLVGPRPIVYEEIEKYSHRYLAYSHMLPGITGLWQTSGRNNTSYTTRVAMDDYYARNWSPWLDVWLLLKTPLVVLTRDGAC